MNALKDHVIALGFISCCWYYSAMVGALCRNGMHISNVTTIGNQWTIMHGYTIAIALMITVFYIAMLIDDYALHSYSYLFIICWACYLVSKNLHFQLKIRMRNYVILFHYLVEVFIMIVNFRCWIDAHLCWTHCWIDEKAMRGSLLDW